MTGKAPLSNVTRDFIPADTARSPLEVEKQKQLRSMGGGKVRLDFIPLPGQEPLPPSGHKAAAAEALERAMARQASAAREEYQAGVNKLSGLNVSQAIEAITQAPLAIQEMLLVAESLNGNRKSILQHFPDVDPEQVTRWKAINDGAPDEASEGTDGSMPEDAKE